MYTSTWCNHGCTFFVLVFFPTKEFGNLALMATLVKPPLGAPPMIPHPSTIWLMSFAILLFYDVVCPCCNTRVRMVLRRAKCFLDILFKTICFTSTSCVSRALSFSGCSRTCLALLCFLGCLGEGSTRNHHRPTRMMNRNPNVLMTHP